MSHDEPRVAADLRRPQGSTSPDGDPLDANGRPSPGDAFFPAPTYPSEDAEATDEPPPPEATVKPAGAGRAVREIVETILLAVVIFVAVRLVVLNFRVDGLSMSPNLDDGEMLLVNRNVYIHFDLNDVLNWVPGVDREGEDIVYPFHPPERGDIVVFEPPSQPSDKPYIKRVIALPGDQVAIQDGDIYVDGELLDEPYIADGITLCSDQSRDCDIGMVPEGHIFVLGDNRRNSQDSRSFGWVDVDAIIGKAWFAYWPSDDIGLVPHEDYPDHEG